MGVKPLNLLAGKAKVWELNYGMAKDKKWIITAAGDRPLRDVAKDLAGAGLKRSEVFEEIGSITGWAADNAVPKIRKVRGVMDVSSDAPIDVGPPDSPETW